MYSGFIASSFVERVSIQDIVIMKLVSLPELTCRNGTDILFKFCDAMDVRSSRYVLICGI